MTDHHLPPGARGLRLADAPTLSVVVASDGEQHVLQACLDALLPQCRQAEAELLVARSSSTDQFEEMARTYPTVRFVVAPTTATIRDLRSAGMAEATGDIVALTEDHRVMASDWLTGLKRGPRGNS